VALTREFLRPGGPESISGLVERVTEGEFDLVALGRILLANPAWVTNAADGNLDTIVDYRKEHEDSYH
jgi:2,4-dienoyl-CoA reductase-like NADH-dependent reductase (Old Yellow Enzyme family)